MARDKEIERYKRALGQAIDALIMYANPETYHAVAFLFDRPCGEFADDFTLVPNSIYDRKMPGKNARTTLRKLERQYGDLAYYSRLAED